MKNLILLGAPGAGKGTQSKLLLAEFGTPQISTGDILREAVRNGTDLGKKVGPLMAEGKLVPDAWVVGIVQERLRLPDCAQGFVLDGFPRTVPQAEALESALKEMGRKLTAVVQLDVPESLIRERLVGRLTCPKCGSVYHVKDHPPRVQGVCDREGAALITRDDDREEKVNKRLREFAELTARLSPYYEEKGLLRRVNGVGAPDAIFRLIKNAVA